MVKAERLKSRKDIQTLFREGEAFSVFPFKVCYRETGLPAADFPAQAGLSVPARNFPRAVDRNRIRRLMREAWRLQKHTLYDFLREHNKKIHLFLIFIGKEIPDHALVNDKLSVILKKLQRALTD